MSVEARVRRLFDYAGLFPPAELAWHDMLRESAGFLQTLRRQGMVASDLVVLADQLADLTPQALAEAGFDDERRIDVCVVGVEAEQAARVSRLIDVFNANNAAQVVALEIHTENPADVLPLLADIRGPALFLEAKWDSGQWAQRGPEMWQALESARQNGRLVGLKIRAAGATALDYPTLAAILQDVVARGLPFKATQGLHHPFVGSHGNQHGFLNVVTGLRMASKLSRVELETLLGDDEAANFHFEDGLAWKTHRLLEQRVQEAEQRVPFTIGSCSLRDPDDGLRALYG